MIQRDEDGLFVSALTIEANSDPDRVRRIAIEESRGDQSSVVQDGSVWRRPGDYRLVQIAGLEPASRGRSRFDLVHCTTNSITTISGKNLGHQCKAFRALSNDVRGSLVFYAPAVDEDKIEIVWAVFNDLLDEIRGIK